MKFTGFSFLASALLFGFLWSCQSRMNDENSRNNSKLLKIADSLYQFNPGGADSVYRVVLKDSASLDPRNYADTLLGLSQIYSNQSAFDTAVYMIGKASKIADHIQDTVLLMECFLLRGKLYLNLGEFDQSRQCFDKGLALAVRSNDIENQYHFNLNLEISILPYIRILS